MDKVVHFEIPVDDWARAEKFYKDNFGWNMMEMKSPDGSQMFYVMMHTAKTDDKGMIQEVGAINGGLFKRSEYKTPLIYIQVASIDESVKKIEASGGKLLSAKAPIPNGSFVRVQDTEGNVFGLVDNSKSEMPK